MAIERTLAFIKPDAVKRQLVGRILQRFEEKQFKVLAMKMLVISSELADKHYEEHVTKFFYPGLKEFIMSGPVVAFVLEGEDVIAAVRKMMGATDPLEASPGTIRGDWGVSKTENLIHASDSAQSASKEINNFFGSALN